jgi:ferredoxin-NADP reductase
MGVEPRFGNDGVAPTGRWHACICVGRIQETQTVFTLCFERIDASPFDFLAGQFITIRFTWAEESFSRVFTIASPPTRADRICLTIKAAEDGVATRILDDHFRENSLVDISDASGEFTLNRLATEKALFLSAGSGITPFVSMARTLHDTGWDLDVCLIQCARTPEDSLFVEELRRLSSAASKLRIETVYSRSAGPAGRQDIGRLDQARLAQLIPDARERTAFMCGPAAFMDAMRTHLLALGVPADRIFEEAFKPRPAIPDPSRGGEEATISFGRSGRSCASAGDATILGLAEAFGIYIETSCQMGVCGTCKVKCCPEKST